MVGDTQMREVFIECSVEELYSVAGIGGRLAKDDFVATAADGDMFIEYVLVTIFSVGDIENIDDVFIRFELEVSALVDGGGLCG